MFHILTSKQKSYVKAILWVGGFCVAVLGLHFAASLLGWYDAFAHMDTVLHFLGGAFLAYAWMVWRHWHWGGDWVSRTEYIFALLGFVLLGGVAWEVFEFFAWTYLPTHALFFKFYSATVSDALGDLVMDTTGGIVMLGIASVHFKKTLKR